MGGWSEYPSGPMRAEFFRPDAPDRVVGVATWDGRRVVVEAEDRDVRDALNHVFASSSVSVEDSSLRPAGTSGPTVVEPGDLTWFRVAARVRGTRRGLPVRFVTDRPPRWDPALDPQTYGWAGSESAVAPS
jgi:hypothetical protein